MGVSIFLISIFLLLVMHLSPHIVQQLQLLGFHDIKPLQAGVSAQVFQAKKSSKLFAVKCVDIRTHYPTYQREVKYLSLLHHPHIVYMYSADKTSCLGFLQLAVLRGDLMDLLESKGHFDEMDARQIFCQICSALDYCHSKGIAHLDIKPENLLYDSDGTVQLADFGMALKFVKNKMKSGRQIGTLGYCAPEVSRQECFYPDKADVWSLGVTLFTLLTGTWPYAAKSEEELRDLQGKGCLHLDDFLHFFSSPLIQLLRQMLQMDPTKRPSVEEILSHPWFQHKEEVTAPRSMRANTQVNLNLTLSLDLLSTCSTNPRLSITPRDDSEETILLTPGRDGKQTPVSFVKTLKSFLTSNKRKLKNKLY